MFSKELWYGPLMVGNKNSFYHGGEKNGLRKKKLSKTRRVQSRAD